MLRMVAWIVASATAGSVAGSWLPVTHKHGYFYVLAGHGDGLTEERGFGDGVAHRLCDREYAVLESARRRVDRDTRAANVWLELNRRWGR